MKKSTLHRLLTYGIAAIWMINGLFCKILNFVPRHQLIVASILGNTYARPLTIAIGISEVIMSVWILTRFQSRLNAVLQMIVIAVMNTLEFILVPELLLWGHFNAVFAGMLIVTVYCNEFILNTKHT